MNNTDLVKQLKIHMFGCELFGPKIYEEWLETPCFAFKKRTPRSMIENHQGHKVEHFLKQNLKELYEQLDKLGCDQK